MDKMIINKEEVEDRTCQPIVIGKFNKKNEIDDTNIIGKINELLIEEEVTMADNVISFVYKDSVNIKENTNKSLKK